LKKKNKTSKRGGAECHKKTRGEEWVGKTGKRKGNPIENKERIRIRVTGNPEDNKETGKRGGGSLRRIARKTIWGEKKRQNENEFPARKACWLETDSDLEAAFEGDFRIAWKNLLGRRREVQKKRRRGEKRRFCLGGDEADLTT